MHRVNKITELRIKLKKVRQKDMLIIKLFNKLKRY